MSKEKLPAAERVRILEGRINNLLSGKGAHGESQRQQQIDSAESALAEAKRDLLEELRLASA